MAYGHCTLSEFMNRRNLWTLVDVANATGYDYGYIRKISAGIMPESRLFQSRLWLILNQANQAQEAA